MPIIEWKEPFSVGVMHLDEQHKKIINMINFLHDEMHKGKSEEVLGNLVNELIVYATTHFKSEAEFFDAYDYPDTDKHLRLHSEFVEKVLKFQDDFKAGKLTLSVEILNFLKDWLINHILGEDKKYGPFLNSQGVN